MKTEQELSNEIEQSIPSLVKQLGNSRDALIPILQGVQAQFRYIPKEAISKISKLLAVHESDIYGVITFYAQFRLNPVGDHIIRVCKGTACHVGGAETVAEILCRLLDINVDETTKDNKFTLEYVACLGCCSLAPAIMIDEDVYGHLTENKIKAILKEY